MIKLIDILREIKINNPNLTSKEVYDFIHDNTKHLENRIEKVTGVLNSFGRRNMEDLKIFLDRMKDSGKLNQIYSKIRDLK